VQVNVKGEMFPKVGVYFLHSVWKRKQN